MQSTNLVNLRTWMQAQNVSALLVPRQDMFQGEYVASHDERLAWVSGFTGSAGFAIISLTEAHLFVDGRYTLQAKLQAADFTIHPMVASEIDKFCRSLKTLHYDPWLLTVQQKSLWQERVTLISLDSNPIDLLWKDRPPAEIKQAYDYTVYAHVHRQEKLANLRQSMEKLDIKSWLISNPESVCWLLNVRGQDLQYVPLLHCMALVTMDQFTLFCEPLKISKELQQTFGVQIACFADMLPALTKANCVITADRNSTPSALLTSDCKFSWQSDGCELNKAKKNYREQAGMFACHRRDAVAMLRFWQWLEKQMATTEIEAQDYLSGCRAQMELYQGDSFATISGFGPHGAIVHYRSTPETNLKIGEGLYLLDSGGQYLDGTTDITRTFCKGTPNQQQRTHYTLVLKGHIALASVRFPIGTTGAQLDVLARQYLWGQGLDYAHGTGHGVGSFLNVHEGPQGITKINTTILQPGMVVSNEPGLYIEGQYGIRIENLQIVQNASYAGYLEFAQLTLVPYEAALIDKAILSASELAWLQQYYQTIWQNLAESLNNAEQIWLKQKLEPYI